MLPLLLAVKGLARALVGVWRDPETKALPVVAEVVRIVVELRRRSRRVEGQTVTGSAIS
jgi:hypothetical protein